MGRRPLPPIYCSGRSPNLNVLKMWEYGNENTMERLQSHVSCYAENYWTADKKMYAFCGSTKGIA